MYGKAPCAAINVNESFFKNNEIEISKDKFLIFDKYFIKKVKLNDLYCNTDHQ